jgi:mannose-6-phosphate isomerase-like protein (cupin superfamily)
MAIATPRQDSLSLMTSAGKDHRRPLITTLPVVDSRVLRITQELLMQELHIDDQVEGPTPPRVVNAVSPNMLRTRVSEVCEEMGEPNWSKLIIADERNFVTLIANTPGTGNRPHWHRNFDEYWVVMEGTLQWELTGGTTIVAEKDDIVFVPRGSVHHIQNIGEGRSLRLAIALPPAEHVWTDCAECGFKA